MKHYGNFQQKKYSTPKINEPVMKLNVAAELQSGTYLTLVEVKYSRRNQVILRPSFPVSFTTE